MTCHFLAAAQSTTYIPRGAVDDPVAEEGEEHSGIVPVTMFSFSCRLIS